MVFNWDLIIEFPESSESGDSRLEDHHTKSWQQGGLVRGLRHRSLDHVDDLVPDQFVLNQEGVP